MPYPYVPDVRNKFFTIEIPDISSADQRYFVPGFSGRIRKIWSVIDGTIATADADLTTKINGTAVTGGLITVTASGSAAGNVDSAVPTALNEFAVGDAIEVETDGASTNAITVMVTLELEPF